MRSTFGGASQDDLERTDSSCGESILIQELNSALDLGIPVPGLELDTRQWMYSDRFRGERPLSNLVDRSRSLAARIGRLASWQGYESNAR